MYILGLSLPTSSVMQMYRLRFLNNDLYEYLFIIWNSRLSLRNYIKVARMERML